MVNFYGNIIANFILAVTFSTIILNLNLVEFKFYTAFKMTLINFAIFTLSYFTVTLVSTPASFLFMFVYLYRKNKHIQNMSVLLILTFIIIGISDVCSGLILMSFLNNSINSIKTSPFSYIELHFILFTVSYILSKLLGIVLTKLKLKNYYVKTYLKNNIAVIIYVATSLAIIYLNAMIYRYFFSKLNTWILTINMVMSLLFFFLSLYIIYTNGKNVEKQITYEFRVKEFEQLKEYTDMLESVSNNLRKFRHDYINILATMNGYIEAKDIDGLCDYFNKEILPENTKINDKNRNLSLLQHVKVTGLKGLLSSKIIYAQSLGIDVSIDIAEDVDEISVETIDLCRIIGILFDNAIEASMLCEEKKIEFGMIRNSDCNTFIISNICNDDTPPVHKIYERGFSTKGKNRGIGLNIVKDIMDEKYDNTLINTTIENTIFKQELIIFCNKKGSH